MLMYVASCAFTLFVSRFALTAAFHALSSSGRIGQRVAIYGADPETVEQAYRILNLQALPQLQLVGVADDRGGARASGMPSLPFIGGFSELVELARTGNVDQVLIALPDINRKRLEEILEELSSVSLDISMIPREALALAPSYKVSFLGEIPLLTFWQRPFRDVNTIVKRTEDLVIASAALLLLSPLLMLTALLIKLSSKGPILFVQPRFGFNNREIFVLKFRSMYAERQDLFGEQRTLKNDARITPVGRIIRKLSIDELPQLWNVMRGDMSIVGPRPHAIHMKVGDRFYFDAVRGYAARHRVKPGITGLAQVRGLRGEIDTIERAKKRVELDKYYIDNWSLGLDLQIIFETAFKIVADKNAY
jgi:Undecaprenyl-phosphate glucose phosphotransferase